LAQSSALKDWDNQDDEIWNDVPAIWSGSVAFSIHWSFVK